MQIKFKKLSPTATTPTRDRAGDLFDLYSDADVECIGASPVVIPTNIAVEIPDGYAIHIYGRSSLSLKKNLCMTGGTGVIDTKYRNGMSLILNAVDPSKPASVKRGEKLCQMAFVPVSSWELIESDEIDCTDCRPGGLGHTGGYAC